MRMETVQEQEPAIALDMTVAHIVSAIEKEIAVEADPAVVAGLSRALALVSGATRGAGHHVGSSVDCAKWRVLVDRLADQANSSSFQVAVADLVCHTNTWGQALATQAAEHGARTFRRRALIAEAALAARASDVSGVVPLLPRLRLALRDIGWDLLPVCATFEMAKAGHEASGLPFASAAAAQDFLRAANQHAPILQAAVLEQVGAAIAAPAMSPEVASFEEFETQ